MPYKPTVKRLLLLQSICLGILSGCATATTVPVETLFQSQQCQIREPRLELLASAAITPLIKRAEGFRIGQKTTPETRLTDDEQGILIAWGSKPNGAYHLSLTGNEATLQDGVLHLPVQLFEPEPGMFTTQVITSPCLVLKIKHNPSIQSLHVKGFER